LLRQGGSNDEAPSITLSRRLPPTEIASVIGLRNLTKSFQAWIEELKQWRLITLYRSDETSSFLPSQKMERKPSRPT